MFTTLLEAKVALEAEGLHVSCNDTHSLWIAASSRDAGPGIALSENACCLMWTPDQCTAVFPAEGMRTYEVPGTLPELVALIASVYAHYRRTGGSLKAAFPRVASGPEQYLAGGAPVRV